MGNTVPTRILGYDSTGAITSNATTQYKVANLSTVALTPTQLATYSGVDRIDCPNMIPPRVYFLVGASWCYVELVNAV